ncbi:hypothetical protein OIU78_009063 [Salix suchowensis]|nr:hypothetical protein OIU78_009063 [Salix suchowensis]
MIFRCSRYSSSDSLSPCNLHHSFFKSSMLFQGFNHTNLLSSWTIMVIIAINHRRSLCHVLVSKYQQTPKKRKEFITPFVVNLLFEFPSNNHHKGYNMPFDFFFIKLWS